MNENVKVVFGLIGGLALFLYGMNSMSDNLQKVAGDRMKKILGYLTCHPIIGALAGAVVTAVLQSSSATTVMVIGFVSAGLMSLPQGISVIFGANIGTTMTAQLLAFKISDYIYPIIFIGFMLYFLSKKEQLKNVGLVIFSFGLLFEGIEIMGSVMKPLASSPIFTNLMGKVSQTPVLGVLLGAGMTLIVQSSSATIAVLQSFASQAGPDGVSSVIGLAGAIPILLGDNIGTTITALLASIGQSRNAKRTALAHSFFNISGSIFFLFLIPLFTRFVQWISPKGPEVEIISRQIANGHTIFNIVCTLIWLPLIPLMVKMVTFAVRGEDQRETEKSQPRFLDENMLSQPMTAMYLVSREIQRCSEYVSELLQAAQSELTGVSVRAEQPVNLDSRPGTGIAAPEQEDVETTDTKIADLQFDELYLTVKQLQESIVTYISRMFARGGLTEGQSEQTAGLLFVINDVDRLADRCQEVTAVTRQMRTAGKVFSDLAKKDLQQCFALTEDLFNRAMQAVTAGNRELAEAVLLDKDKMRKAEKKFKKAHLTRVEENTCDASMTQDYTTVLHGLDRMIDSCIGIAEEAMETAYFITSEELGLQEQGNETFWR